MSTDSTNANSASRGLNIALWVAQALLGAMFLMAGGMKLLTPIAEIAKKMTWAGELPWLVRFIGISEVAGALGVILPAATRIKPILTPIAAIGLLVIMVLATAFHIWQGDAAHIGIPLVLLALAGFVAWGRFGQAQIAPR